jgi:hypothetical protein
MADRRKHHKAADMPGIEAENSAVKPFGLAQAASRVMGMGVLENFGNSGQGISALRRGGTIDGTLNQTVSPVS